MATIITWSNVATGDTTVENAFHAGELERYRDPIKVISCDIREDGAGDTTVSFRYRPAYYTGPDLF